MGDHLRLRRLKAGLHQREVAERIGVGVRTVLNWERGWKEPAIRYLPGIIEFLGYVPFEVEDSLPNRIRAYRWMHGLTKERFAEILGVDRNTLWRWESGRSLPRDDLRERIEALLGSS